MAKTKGLDYDHESIYPNKKCLSSSQVISYYENPAQFFEEYELGIRKGTSEAMHIGKVFSAMYEDRKFDWRKAMRDFGVTNQRIYRALEEAIGYFPVIPKRECEYPLKCKYRGWEFRATLDGYHDKRIDIENKTGQTVWDQERADNSIQVTFQYWVKFKKDKKLFDECQLNWVDLRARSRRLVNPLVTHRTYEQLDEFQKIVDRVIDGIEAQDWSDSGYKPKYW